VVHANTDPNITAAMATLGVGAEEAAVRKAKVAGGGGRTQGPATTGRPLPPISKRRRASSESSAPAPDTLKQH